MATKFKNLSFDLQIRRSININMEEVLKDHPELNEEEFCKENGIEDESDVLNYLMEVDPMVIFASDSKFVEGEEVEDMIF